MKGETLRVTVVPCGKAVRQVKASADLLGDFVGLEKAPAEAILKYARRHGRLGLCRHGDASHGPRIEGCRAAVCRPASGQMAMRESLDWWRTMAGHARALLSLAAQLSKGEVHDLSLGQVNQQLPGYDLRAARRDPWSFVALGRKCGCSFFECVHGSPTIRSGSALRVRQAVPRHYPVRWQYRSCSRLRVRLESPSVRAVGRPSLLHAGQT